MTDSIADMLSIIKNGYLAKKIRVEISCTKILKALIDLLIREGYVLQCANKEDSGQKKLIVTLKYDNNKPALTNIQRISKPGRRFYVGKNNIPRVLGGIGKVFISTPKGLMTGEEAKKKGLGGEIICKIW